MNRPSTGTLIAVFIIGALVGIVALLTTTPMFATRGPGMMGSDAMATTEFNRADIRFMNMMSVHHDQAVQMAALAQNRTDNKTITALATNISKAQQREINQMGDWLQQAGFTPPLERDHMQGNMGHRMGGMASEEEMQRLKQSRGEAFDALFAELMIEHHEGGVDMAQRQIQSGASDKLTSLAEDMVRVQQREIALMERWQNTTKS